MKKYTYLVLPVALFALIVATPTLAYGGKRDGGKVRVPREQFVEKHGQAVASALGISVEDLTKRLDSGKKLPDIAKELGISDADLKVRMEKAGAELHHFDHQFDPTKISDKHLESVAKVLGLSLTDLQARLDQGKKLPDLAQDLGISRDELMKRLHTARLEQYKQHLDAQVQAGALTREQADAAYKKAEENSGKHLLPEKGKGRLPFHKMQRAKVSAMAK